MFTREKNLTPSIKYGILKTLQVFTRGKLEFGIKYDILKTQEMFTRGIWVLKSLEVFTRGSLKSSIKYDILKTPEMFTRGKLNTQYKFWYFDLVVFINRKLKT